MPEVKSTAATAEKWGRVTPQRTEDYERGIANPRRPWEQATQAAVQNYNAGITASITKGSFARGVARTGQAGYLAAAQAKGPRRFAEGVQVGTSKYAARVAPYLDTIRATTLPPRFPKGDPRNIARVAAIAKALSDKKLSGS